MAITVVGSVAFDTVETPAGRRERCLAGAATYFSLSASFFTDVRVIAVVGDDFGSDQQKVFDARKIDTTGIQHRPGKSFFWQGSYMENLNEAKTINTELNVFAGFEPSIPPSYSDSEFLFLANIDPAEQLLIRKSLQVGRKLRPAAVRAVPEPHGFEFSRKKRAPDETQLHSRRRLGL